MLRSQTP